MLTSLYIRNYVLIDQLDIRFDKGLSVITGETGAGKSIILGALSMVLGQRADGKNIRQGADRCIIEAEFDITAYDIASFFQENDLEYDPANCLLRRELYLNGKSRAFVNDSPVSLNILKELGTRLIDIHSQHQNLLLNDNHFQLRVVDIMAQNTSLLHTYYSDYALYQSLQKEWKDLSEKAIQSSQEQDYIRFQLEQLTESRLQSGEQEALEEEQELLTHAEEIKNSLYQITDLLQREEQGGIRLIKEALTVARSLERYYPKAKEIGDRLHTAYIDLSDLAGETDSRKEDIEFNPERMEWVNERLNVIYNLQQKHRLATVDELLHLQTEYQEQLKEIDSFEAQLEVLKSKIDQTYQSLSRQAEILHQRRQQASGRISAQLVSMIAPLGMPHARFQVDLRLKDKPGNDGLDDVRFLFSAHKSGELQPVSQIASGGEISRLMLCLKTMIAGFTALPTIIFDEVDMGVSGDIADRMGEIMQQLSSNMQVITITHLPQIAAKGRSHYFVYKEDTPERTVTDIRSLSKEERVREIARMLSGATLTEASIANARELLH